MSQPYEIRLAEPHDSDALLSLINQTPQEGQVQLNFERLPNFFHGTQVTTTEPDVWVMLDHKRNILLASFSIGKREVYVGGKKRMTRYGNDLRIHQDYRGGRILLRLFKKYRELMQDEWMQTVILDDNKASINSVGSGRLSLPTYYKCGQFRTHMVDLKKKQYQKINCTVRRALEEDKKSMQAFFDENAPLKEFYPCYDFSKIGTDHAYYRDIKIDDYFLAFRDKVLVGVCGVWDQKAFKQTRFVSYQGKMKYLRHINNIKSHLIGGLQLPKPGNLANYLSLHSILCVDNDAGIFKDLLNAVLKIYHDSLYESLIFGFDTRDPLHQAADGLKAYQLLSNHYLASYHSDPAEELDQQGLIYLEPARL
jgi:hypothetical protein